MLKLPEHYETLEETLEASIKVLENAVENRRSLFHTPVLSTFSDSKINSRVIVLRAFDPEKRILRIHSDSRSRKIKDVSENSDATLLGYDPGLKIQLKLHGSIDTHYQDNIADLAWRDSQEMSKVCYSISESPGKEIDDPGKYDVDSENINIDEGYKNFAVINFHFNSLEFLYLRSSGHRRSIHLWETEELRSNWMVP
jgi:hypothetical protein